MSGQARVDPLQHGLPALSHLCSGVKLRCHRSQTGCLNGGGQLKPRPGQTQQQLIEALEKAYHPESKMSQQSPRVRLAAVVSVLRPRACMVNCLHGASCNFLPAVSAHSRRHSPSRCQRGRALFDVNRRVRWCGTCTASSWAGGHTRQRHGRCCTRGTMRATSRQRLP